MRGRYRILLGMAAGVGKTYRMLQEGRQAHAEGVDVVIGYLEPHDRPETAALAEGLEAVPHLRSARRRRRAGGDGRRRRRSAGRPELALVDELAHTNLPEARNRKRYEDIDEILDAGIAVTSTVNIQHLESLNDEVFELTGVRVRETFPDRILDEADEVVLVDLAPEALQERLRHGKVYPAARVDTALTNFFRLENLAALRELVAARARRGRRGAPDDGGARPAEPAGGRRADPRAGHAGAALAADPAPRLPLRAAARARRSTRSGCASPGQQLERGRDGVAGGAAPAGERPRRALHRARGRQPPRDRQAVRRRAGLDLRLPRHARRVAPHARSCAARSSRSSCATCPASTSASSPTARCARSRSGDGYVAHRRGSCRARGCARRSSRSAGAAHGSTHARRRRGCSCRSRAAASTRRVLGGRHPDRARRGRDARPGLPDRGAARAAGGRADAGSRSRPRCRCSRRSSTPPSARACRSTRGSRAAARRSTRSSASGRPSTSTGSSSRRPPTGRTAASRRRT